MRTCRTTSASASKRMVRSTSCRGWPESPADRRRRGRIRQPLVVERRHLAVELDDDPHRVGQHDARMSLIVTTRGAAARLVAGGLDRRRRRRRARSGWLRWRRRRLGRVVSGRCSIDATTDGTCFANLLVGYSEASSAQQPDARRPGPRRRRTSRRRRATAGRRATAHRRSRRWSETAGRSLRSRRRPCAPPSAAASVTRRIGERRADRLLLGARVEEQLLDAAAAAAAAAGAAHQATCSDQRSRVTRGSHRSCASTSSK